MKRVDRYIAGYMVGVFVNVLGVLVGMMLIHRFYRIIDLAVSRALTLFETSQLIFWALPMAFLYAAPMAALTGALLAFGKLSADEETTACFAAGISRARMAAIPFAFGLIIAVFTLFNNTVLAPGGYRFFDRIGFGVGLDPFRSLKPDQMTRIEGRFFAVGGIDPDARTLDDFFAVVPRGDLGLENSSSRLAIVAARGQWLFSDQSVLLRLDRGSALELVDPGAGALGPRRFEFGEMDIRIPLANSRSTESKRLTMTELFERRERGDVAEAVRRLGGALSPLLLIFCALPFVLRARGAVRRASARGAIVYAVVLYFLFWIANALAESVYENYRTHFAVLGAPYLLFLVAGIWFWRFKR